MQYAPTLRRLIAGEHLSAAEAAQLIGEIMDGSLSPVQGAGLLVALAAKGEHPQEVAGAARAMRERSLHVEHGLSHVVDVVGTGGDGANTINISTIAAFVAAAAGMRVAKHGNRAASSACGSADVLEAAGMRIDLTPDEAASMLRETGFAFMFAPRYHPAMKNVAPIRRELGVRTVFNILGPLTNPARATRAVIGVAREHLVELVGRVLAQLGAERAAIVYGTDGLDEIGGEGPSRVFEITTDGTKEWTLDPATFGVTTPLRALASSSVEQSRDAFFSILDGERSPRADVVALNAALVLYLEEPSVPMPDAFERARALLHSGEARKAFERAKEFAHV